MVDIIYTSPVGLIKGFKTTNKQPVHISNINSAGVTSLSWLTEDSILAGTNNGSIIRQDVSSQNYSVAITGSGDGIVGLLPDNSPVSASKFLRPYLAIGGKDLNLKLWDVEHSTKCIFEAKNVRPSTLRLEVPIWISDICFVPNTNGRLILTVSRHGELSLYDTRCGQRRPVSRHAWRMSRTHGKVKVGKCSHGAILPDLACTRPITRGLAIDNAPGGGIRVIAANVIGDLCFLEMRMARTLQTIIAAGDDEKVAVGSIKSFGGRAPEAPLGVQRLSGASGTITGLACGGVTDGMINSPIASGAALFNSQPYIIVSSLDRYLRIYHRDTGERLAKCAPYLKYILVDTRSIPAPSSIQLYAKVPVASFLIADKADFSQIHRLADSSASENIGGEDVGSEGDAAESAMSDEDSDLDELWGQLDEVVDADDADDDADDDNQADVDSAAPPSEEKKPKGKKNKRKRKG